jgi:hypothetical protein
MTKKHSITICAFLAVTGAESLPAQTLERACTSATSQYYDAFAAGDHNAAERLTHERLKTCKAAGFPDFFLSQIYGDLAGILNSEHRWSEALRAADAGIANYYTSPACHYERRQSLIMLRKKAEAGKERQTLLVVSA